jgi:hypothetical protein
VALTHGLTSPVQGAARVLSQRSRGTLRRDGIRERLVEGLEAFRPGL